MKHKLTSKKWIHLKKHINYKNLLKEKYNIKE